MHLYRFAYFCDQNRAILVSMLYSLLEQLRVYMELTLPKQDRISARVPHACERAMGLSQPIPYI